MAVTLDLAVLGINYFTYTVGDNAPRERIFYRHYAALDLCFHLGILERKVAPLRFTIYKFKIFTVTQRLRAYNLAIYKGEIFRIPAEVFSLDDRIFYRYVFFFFLRVLSVEIAIFYNGVFHILEGIFPLEVHAFQMNIRSH